MYIYQISILDIGEKYKKTILKLIQVGKSASTTVNYPKYQVFFKEHNAGFSTQIHRVTNNWLKKTCYLPSVFCLIHSMYILRYYHTYIIQPVS